MYVYIYAYLYIHLIQMRCKYNEPYMQGSEDPLLISSLHVIFFKRALDGWFFCGISFEKHANLCFLNSL